MGWMSGRETKKIWQNILMNWQNVVEVYGSLSAKYAIFSSLKFCRVFLDLKEKIMFLSSVVLCLGH